MPAIQSDPGASAAALQWVLAGYGLAFGAGDHRWPAWRSPRAPPGLRLGPALFTITSAECGFAPSPGILVAARVAQGMASALLMPQVLAIIGVAYEGEDRVKAMTAYALTMGLAAVAGQLIGGLLIDANIAGLDWRSCFLVNVPVGIAALVLTPRVVQESKAEGKGRLDLLGAVVVTAALVAIVLPLIQGREQGWPAWTWISLAIAPVLLVDSRTCSAKIAGRGGSPLVHPGLFAERSFGVGLAGIGLFQATMASFFLVLAIYLQEGRGLSPVQAGLLFTSSEPATCRLRSSPPRRLSASGARSWRWAPGCGLSGSSACGPRSTGSAAAAAWPGWSRPCSSTAPAWAS
jgi:MFS family permease